MSSDLALKPVESFSRNRQPEMMDQPGLAHAEHRHALTGLARLNAWTGVAGNMYKQFRDLATRRSDHTIRVLDVASGAGDLPIAWAKRACREGLNLQITTLDISDFAVETQTAMAHRAGVHLNAIQQDCLGKPLPEGFDVITNSLFLHHLEDDDAVKLIRRMHLASQNRVVVCDLERSRLNLGLVKLGSHALSRSKIVHNDGPLSVRGAFTIDELAKLAGKATGSLVEVKRAFPCRMSFVLEN